MYIGYNILRTGNNTFPLLYYTGDVTNHHSITVFPLSHYANGFSHSPYGTSCIEAKPQPEIQPNGSFDERFPSSHAYHNENGSFG